MHLEHQEHWEASDASWLYAAIYDADSITGRAYFQVFVIAQAIFALFLSIVLVLGLAYWGYAVKVAAGDGDVASPGNVQSTWYCVGVLIIIPLGLGVVLTRRKLIWVAVLIRKDLECAWFKSCVWIMTNWRSFHALQISEKAALEKRVLKQNSDFIPAHWDARDVANDTTWVSTWIQGVSYCAVLLFGTFSLCDYQTYGIGAMEVGTFYALCKIYLTVGKYVGLLNSAVVDMQQAVVSLREIAALLNQRSQRSLRREAAQWARVTTSYTCSQLFQERAWRTTCESSIVFPHGTCFVRPANDKVGSTFAELRVKGCSIPLGRVVHVTARNERVLRSFLGLAAQVLQPTTEQGEELPDDAPGVVVPLGKKVGMLPLGPIGMGPTAPSVIEQLEFTGAPRGLCMALAESVGLEPRRPTATLGAGSQQVFSIIRAILLDRDVLCAHRPVDTAPLDMQKNLVVLLRVWQGGGLPLVAEMLGEKLTEGPPVYRPAHRTLVVGNPTAELWGGWLTDVHMDLDQYLLTEEGVSPSSDLDFAEGQGSASAPPPPMPSVSGSPLLRVRPARLPLRPHDPRQVTARDECLAPVSPAYGSP